MDTIFAPATAQSISAIACVRVSGPDAFLSYDLLSNGKPRPNFRKMELVRLVDHQKQLIDVGLVVLFKGPYSFTGEDVVEYYIHGSYASLDHMLVNLGQIKALRYAKPGEFSQRAYQNKKMSLLEIEGLSDLLASESRLQKQIALEQLEGRGDEIITQWRDEFLGIIAVVEAMIDFSDDVEDQEIAAVLFDIHSLQQKIMATIPADSVREVFNDDYSLAFVGAPNSGKSSLINCLMNREVSIVSPFAGTTRDVIEAVTVIGNVKVRLLDLAGIRDSNDPIEKIGIAKAQKALERASIRVFLDAPDAPLPEDLKQTYFLPGDLIVTTKSDLGIKGTGLQISIKDQSYQALLDAVAERFTNISPKKDQIFFRARHVDCLKQTMSFLEYGYFLLKDHELFDSCAVQLRSAVQTLDYILGRVTSEDVLDVIFSKFCIGK